MTEPQVSPFHNPDDRQVLAAIGNRYVVFGSESRLRGAATLGPADVKTRLPRVGYDHQNSESRLIQSLVVEGSEVRLAGERDFGDVELIDAAGRTTLVEIKVGDRDFAGLNLGQAWKDLGQGDDHREIWGFNTERLTLGIVWSGKRFGTGFSELRALDVWEYDEHGSVFDRSKVVAEVDDWSRRVSALYDEVEAWAREEGFTALRDRAIPMSEELMQRFAVPDRDMPILDLMEGETPVLTMKPDGLWLIGFNGLIDVITPHGTVWLAGIPQTPNPPAWMLVEPRDRSRRAWGRDAFRAVLERVTAGE